MSDDLVTWLIFFVLLTIGNVYLVLEAGYQGEVAVLDSEKSMARIWFFASGLIIGAEILFVLAGMVDGEPFFRGFLGLVFLYACIEGYSRGKQKGESYLEKNKGIWK